MPRPVRRAAAPRRRFPVRLARAVTAWLARPGRRWRGRVLRRRTVGRLALLGIGAALAACVPGSRPGELEPTLRMETVTGGEVAVQNGLPVPTFERQDRPRIDLDGEWRVERREFDSNLSLTPRAASLPAIEAEADGRTSPEFDDSGWEGLAVPGALNLPPDRREIGAWYRRTFAVPEAWVGQAVTLKFGAVNYVADVWLNGIWLGYHEGGTTPFAFDVGATLRAGADNTIVVRVDNPVWGSRNDIVPWGLADWWNFGGLTRSVWLEATNPVHVVRADVSPHLDGGDVGLVLHNRGTERRTATVTVEVLPGLVTDENLVAEAPSALLTGAAAVATLALEPVDLGPDEVVRLDGAFLLGEASPWSPAAPSLYVLRVRTRVDGRTTDLVHESFGIRQVALDPRAPAVQLNGRIVSLPGVALHDQRLFVEPATDGGELRVGGRPSTTEDILLHLDHARRVGARLIRAGHSPANPMLLRLADRLGFAVWEEIPLYHYTPQTFGIAMERGIPQQMLREMALRDMNRPSVLFHGLANESTGEEPRRDALAELHEIDRAIDGTRLTGQAAYGFNPADPTSEPLDVAGYTFYYGVFYGSDPAADTAAALALAHQTYPDKPIMALEFGRWADGPGGPAAQRRIFEETSRELFERRATRPGGYVGSAVWWTLEDYATLRPRIEIEHFGMYAYDGTPRPVAEAAAAVFPAIPAGLDPDASALPVPGGRGTSVTSTRSGAQLLGYLAYGALVTIAILALGLATLVWRGGRGRRPRDWRWDAPR